MQRNGINKYFDLWISLGLVGSHPDSLALICSIR